MGQTVPAGYGPYPARNTTVNGQQLMFPAAKDRWPNPKEGIWAGIIVFTTSSQYF